MSPCQPRHIHPGLVVLLELTGSDHGQKMGAGPCRGSVRSGHLSCGAPTQLEEDAHAKKNTLPAKPDVGKG